MTQFSFSGDEESFQGQFDTREEAIVEAAKTYPRFWTGSNRKPVSPENYWDADDWLDQVSVQEEYSLECAIDWDDSTKEQREELEAEVRPILRKWLERHGLLPKFWHVEDIKQHTVVLDGTDEPRIETTDY